MIDNLLEIEIAYSMLDESNNNVEGDEHPIDGHYKKLKCDLQAVDRHSEEFLRIEQYMIKTHAKTHDQYTLKLRDLFKTSRQGESVRTKKFQQLDNHQLLWHGSRTTNFAGILSQGLRIAPPEAPVVSDSQSGNDAPLFSFRQVTCLAKEFTSPIWSRKVVSSRFRTCPPFDQISCVHLANYCFTTKQSPEGLMLLCDVALGKMYECNKATNFSATTLPKGTHSCKGCGSTIPDPKGNRSDCFPSQTTYVIWLSQ